MLGKSNLLYVEGEGSTELVFNPEYILTSSSSYIHKIEYINRLFFVFTADAKVLYGSDIENLQTLKNEDEAVPAKHIIFADDVYYMTKIENTTGKAVILKTADLSSFEEITLKTGDSSYSYPVHGLFLNSSGQIVALIEQYVSDTGSTNKRYLLITDSLNDYDENNSNIIELSNGAIIYGRTATYTTMKKDRIFTTLRGSTSTSMIGVIITLDGTVTTYVEKYTSFAADYFFRINNSYNVYTLYYSINGVDYIAIDFSSVEGFLPGTIFEYDGNIALIYSCTENEATVKKMTIASTPKGLVEATNDAIPVTIDYAIYPDSDIYQNDYVYIGCSGGIIIKAKLEYSDSSLTPEVVVIKTLAAKEALSQANAYTDETAAELRIEAQISETVKGDRIVLPDSTDNKAKGFALYGKCTQGGTTGKNIISENTVNVSKTAAYGATDIPFDVEENTDYTISLIFNQNTSTLNKIGVSIYKIGVAEFLVDKTYTAKSETISFSFNSADNTQLRLKLLSNVSDSVVTEANVDFTNIQIEKGTAATAFEPYTGGIPSPNPDYSQEITIAGSGGSVEVKRTGKNLLKNTATTMTENGITFTVNDDGSVTVNGTATGTANIILVGKEFFSSHAGKNVTISGCPKGSNLKVQIWQGVGNPPIIDTGSGATGVVLERDEALSMNIAIQVAMGTTVNNVTVYPMVRPASIFDDTYEPYNEATYTISTPNGLAGIPVETGGNYTDENGQEWVCDEIIRYTDGTGKYIKNVHTITVDGTVTGDVWGYGKGGTTDNHFYWVYPVEIPKYHCNSTAIDIMDKSNFIDWGTFKQLYSTHFTAYDYKTLQENGKPGISYGWGSVDEYEIRFGMGIDSEVNTVELFKEWCTANNPKVTYELATPIETDLSAIQLAELDKIRTLYPSTVFSNENDCGMSVTYLIDLKNYIDNKIAAIRAEITA